MQKNTPKVIDEMMPSQLHQTQQNTGQNEHLDIFSGVYQKGPKNVQMPNVYRGLRPFGPDFKNG